MSSEPKHAKLGASGSERWLNCPASVRICETLADEPSSMYAEEGTAAHTLAEKCLNTGKSAYAYQGMTIVTEEGNEFEVDDDMAEAVQVFVDEINSVREELGPNATLNVEAKFHLTDIHEDMYGTNDASLCEPFGTLYVFDYKHGAGVPVEAIGNTQMRFYALGAMQHYDYMYEWIEMVIVQPRAQHPDGPIRRERISADELVKWGEEVLKPGALLTLKEDAPFKCGKWCRWCKAAPICPEQRKFVMESAKAAFDDNYIPKEQQTFEKPESMSPKELGLVLKFTDQLKTWCKQVEDFALGRLLHGKEIEGFKLVYGRSSRKWNDEASVIAAYESTFGEDLYKKKILTPAQLEKTIKDYYPGKQKKKLRDKAVAEMASLVVTKAPKVLAPEDDKRPVASGLEAGDAFADI